MPTYTFINNAGQRVERVMSYKEYDRRVRDGVLHDGPDTLTRDYGADIFGGTPANGWPILSDAMGVHPRQRQKAYEESVAKGVPTEFAHDGRAILRDRTHRAKFIKALGDHDHDGGYGD